MRAVAIVAVVLGVAGAAGGATVPADLAPARLTLQSADLPAARLDSQGPVHERGYAAGYQRTFVYRAPGGRSRFVYVLSEALLANTVVDAAAELDRLRVGLTSKAGRSAYARAIAKALAVKAAGVRVSSPRAPRVGDRAFELPLDVRVGGRRLYESLLYMQLDRVVSVLVSAGTRPLVASETRALATAAARHVAAALKPRSLAVPTIVGEAQQGSVLTATTGDWSGEVTFTYQWQRCQEATTCTDIAGAAGETYTAAEADVGFGLRVAVTAVNRFGTATAVSAATSAVAAPPSPPGPELP